MYVRNLGYTPLKTGTQKPHFSTTLQLNGKFYGLYIFGTKHDIHNRTSALDITKIFYIVSKYHELWSTNSLKLDRCFYPPSVNTAFYFIARLCRRRSATELNQNLPNAGQ